MVYSCAKVLEIWCMHYGFYDHYTKSIYLTRMSLQLSFPIVINSVSDAAEDSSIFCLNKLSSDSETCSRSLLYWVSFFFNILYFVAMYAQCQLFCIGTPPQEILCFVDGMWYTCKYMYTCRESQSWENVSNVNWFWKDALLYNGKFWWWFNLVIWQLKSQSQSPTFCHMRMSIRISHRDCSSLCSWSQKHDGEMLVCVGLRPRWRHDSYRHQCHSPNYVTSFLAIASNNLSISGYIWI